MAAAVCVAVVALFGAIGYAAPASAFAQSSPRTCSHGLVTADGCEPVTVVRRNLRRILADAKSEYGLKAAIVRIDADRRTMLRTAIGRSQAGRPARPKMHFRIGSMSLPWLTSVVLQLRDAGRISLGDKVARWFPELPRADRVTVRMLMNSTSGYYDYIQGNDEFLDLVHTYPFRQWRPGRLLNIALARGFACDPGQCFNYAHTNFILLARIVQKVTGRSMQSQMERRILGPLGLRETAISPKPAIPRPALHAYTAERGFYEDSTGWSPSWGLGSGSLATSTIDDLADSARPIFTGTLISRRSHRQMVAPSTASLPPFNESTYYGLGMAVSDDWRLQNPFFNGYVGILGYLPAGKLTIALMTTNRRAASESGANFSEKTFARFTRYLSPQHPTHFTP